MAHVDILQGLPFTAASALGQYVVVTGDSTTKEQVFAAGSVTADPLGVTIATTPSYGLAADVVVSGVVKINVAASLGAFARVGVASLNGAIGPVGASGLGTSLGSALGAGIPRYSVGIAVGPALPGEYVSVYLDPRQII